jgi:hypothetical protein
MKRTPDLQTGDILILRGALGRVKEHSRSQAAARGYRRRLDGPPQERASAQPRAIDVVDMHGRRAYHAI